MRWLAPLLVVLAHATPSRAEPWPTFDHPAPERDRLGWAVPDYVRLQSGGYLGMGAVSVGYSALRDVINVGAGYGFVPAEAEAPAVHILHALVLLRPLRFGVGDDQRVFVYPIYAGTGVMAAIGPNLFIQQPDEYPGGYYPASGLHYLALVGAELAVRENERRFFQRHSVFWELVSFDQYLDAFFQNPDVSLLDAAASTVGYRASF
jgi:hypothetical protein